VTARAMSLTRLVLIGASPPSANDSQVHVLTIVLSLVENEQFKYYLHHPLRCVVIFLRNIFFLFACKTVPRSNCFLGAFALKAFVFLAISFPAPRLRASALASSNLLRLRHPPQRRLRCWPRLRLPVLARAKAAATRRRDAAIPAATLASLKLPRNPVTLGTLWVIGRGTGLD
jgi:hypothetical protein